MFHLVHPMNPAVFWIYGLSGAGKTSIAQKVGERLRAHGQACLVLDGDDLRAGVCSDLGFSSKGRMENIRRAAQIARLACQQGLPVIAAFMTPEKAMRDAARSILQPLTFSEIFLNCDYQTCRQRDVKGLYARVAENQLTNFCGSDLGFDVPTAPDLTVDTRILTLQHSVQRVMEFVEMKMSLPTGSADGQKRSWSSTSLQA
jgi:adenylylsulfate kinase